MLGLATERAMIAAAKTRACHNNGKDLILAKISIQNTALKTGGTFGSDDTNSRMIVGDKIWPKKRRTYKVLSLDLNVFQDSRHIHSMVAQQPALLPV